MEPEQYELGVTAPRARHVQRVVTSTTTETTHAPRRPSQLAAPGDGNVALPASSAAVLSPNDYALLHLGPATTTTTVTTTTHTTTHFAPLRIPKSRPLRPVYSSFSGPAGDAAPRYDPPLTPKTSLRRLFENEAAAPGGAARGSALPLDPRMYPLSQAEWPGSMRQFRMALGGMHATFVEDAADVPEGQRRQGVALGAAEAKGKGKEPALPTPSRVEEDDEDVSPFGTSAARDGRGPLHQRRLSRRARAHGGGQVLEWMDEEVDGEVAATGERRQVSPGPPRKRPRADSTAADALRASADVDMGAMHAAAVAGRRASQALLNPFAAPVPASVNPVMAATLPSPNQSPPSPVPTAGGYDSQGFDGDELIGEAVGEDEVQTFDFGSGAALSSLLSLPDFIKTFDDLPPALQSYTIFQLLRRAPLPVLQTLNQVIEPSLRRDFLSDLPPELGATILGFLDAQTLCRATLVCRAWKRLVDGDALPRVWKDKLQADGMWVGDGSDEREALEIARGYSEDLFTKRWIAGVWDEQDSSKVKVEVSEPSTSSMHPATTFEHRLASPSSSREASPFPPSHTVPAYKTLYRRRLLTRYNWKHGTPIRTTFPSSTVPAGNPNTGNNVVTCLQFDHDKIVSASDDHTINVFDMQNGGLRANLAGHIGGVWALQYIGNVLVSGSTDRTVRVWDLAQARCTHIFVGHTSTVRCLQIIEPENINPDAHGEPIWQPAYPLVVTGSRDFSLRVWKLPMPGKDRDYLPKMPEHEDEQDPASMNPYHLRHLTGHSQAVRALSAKGDTLVSGSYDMEVRVWDISTGRCRHVLRGHSQKVYSVVYDHLRKQCASGSMDGTVRLWSTEAGECRAVLEGHTSLVGLLGLTHRNLVSAAADWTLRIWDPATGACKHSLAAHQGAITCFQHDEHKVISGSDGTLKMWDVQTGEFVRDLLTNLTGVWQVAFDQRYCVSAVSRNGRSEFEILDFGAVDPEPVVRREAAAPTPRIKAEEVDDVGALTDARIVGANDIGSAEQAVGTPAAEPSASGLTAPSAPRLRPAGFPSSDSHGSLSALAADTTPSAVSLAISDAIRRSVRRTDGSADLRAQSQASAAAMDVDGAPLDGGDDEMAGIGAAGSDEY
ncbi:SCF ubiquitin ligase complex subunit cdc4 [Rhodotorula kratochvilovae]